MADFCEPNEINAIISNISNVSLHPERDTLLCKLMWQSGCRVTEAITLHPEHIGKSSVVLRNLKQVKRIKKRTINPDTGKYQYEITRLHDATAVKEVEITESLCTELKEFCKENKIVDGEWVFQSNWRKSQHVPRGYVWRLIDKASRNAGIIKFGKRNPATGGRFKGAYPHIFRHSTGMLLMDKTSNIRLVQQHLGHANIQTTTIYAHTTKQKLREAIDKIDWEGTKESKGGK